MRVVILLVALCVYYISAHTVVTNVVINGVKETKCLRPKYPGNLYASTNMGADTPISSSNFLSNGITSNNYTCGFLPYAANPASAKCTVAAGSTVGVQYYHGGNYGNEDPVLDKCIARSHKGPIMAFLANSDTGSGNVWFKIFQAGKLNDYTGSDYNGVSWASADLLLQNDCTVYFTIPSDIAPGNYLLRSEIIAMHDSGSHGAQPYVQCTELTITGSGSARPAGVAIPGAWNYDSPGITYNIYSQYKNPYPFPGPAVYVPGSTASTTTSSSTTAKATTGSTTTTTTTTGSSTTAKATTGSTTTTTTSSSITTGVYTTSTTGAFQKINVKVTIRVNLAPKDIDISYLVYEITQILGIPSSSLSDVTIDLDKSSGTQTVIQFTIWNEMKNDGTRVNPVAVALRLQTMAANKDPVLSTTSYLGGMAVIDQQEVEGDGSSSASVIKAVFALVAALCVLLL